MRRAKLTHHELSAALRRAGCGCAEEVQVAILENNGFSHGYIDAFSGPGLHIRKAGGEEVLGSPLVALGVQPPFDEYHFIDLDGKKVDFLRAQVGSRPG